MDIHLKDRELIKHAPKKIPDPINPTQFKTVDPVSTNGMKKYYPRK